MADYTDTQLGRETSYSDQYDASLLGPIPRSKARGATAEATAFTGVDVWTAFEISWLNNDGLPQVAIGEFIFPCISDAIIESKSFKLYLNSFNQSHFPSMQALSDVMRADLSVASGSTVDVILYQIGEYNGLKPIAEPDAICLDQRPVATDVYEPEVGFLQADDQVEADETLCSHLLRTNCPVTDQPDWASVYISYRGAQIDRDGLLKYLVSFRQHQDFHEQCVEKIFGDIMARCKPCELSVYARYMRRGGLDINPYRSTLFKMPPNYRQVRQ